MEEDKNIARRVFLREAGKGVALVFAGGNLLFKLGCGSSDGSTPQPIPPCPVIIDPPEPSEKSKGITVTSWWHNDYSGPHIDNTLNLVKGMNANTVCIVPTHYVSSPSSPDIYASPIKTPSDYGIESILDQAKAKGMRTILKPHVDPLTGWKGQISFTNESDWATFFAKYKNMILHYAAIAASKNVDVFVEGVELKGTTHREAEWRDIDNGVKDIFSGKPIKRTYAANHDNYQNVPFWDALDYIGIDAYFPLTNKFDPTKQELDQAWISIGQGLENFSQQHNKKILITELGYQSYDGTNISSWWAPTTIADPNEQNLCIDSGLGYLLPKDCIIGVLLWHMHHDLVDHDGFAVQGKLAEQTVRNHYGSS